MPDNEGARLLGEAINQGINETVVQPITKHLAAPPLQKNRNRAVWGTRLIVAGICLAHVGWMASNDSVVLLAHFYWHGLHLSLDQSWPVYGWTAGMLLGLVWLLVGLKGSRAPRDVMMALWAMVRVAAFAAALWWYPGVDPQGDWLIQSVIITLLASSLMSLYLAMRGTGSGAVQLVQQQITRQQRIFRIGRRRSF
jgi:hypothetical protein